MDTDTGIQRGSCASEGMGREERDERILSDATAIRAGATQRRAQERGLALAESISVLDLPSMTMENRIALPNCPAVYFVLNSNNAILYIGQTISLVRRWMAHHRTKELVAVGSTRIAWLEVSDTALLKGIEQACIAHFDPMLNQRNAQLDRAFSLRASVRLYTALVRLARRDHRRLADYVRLALEKHVEEHENKD